jgi:hypothetical protein
MAKTSEAGMKTSEVLRAALEKLGPNGENWAKGTFLRTRWFGLRQPSHCAIGAMIAVHKFWWPAADTFRAALCEMGFHGTPAMFNDAPERTFSDVKAAFLKAISLAEADEVQA